MYLLIPHPVYNYDLPWMSLKTGMPDELHTSGIAP